MNTIQHDSQNFKQLYFSKVNKKDIGHVIDELPKLKKMAEKYDVYLSSERVNIGNVHNLYDAIKVTVSPLKENLNFIKKIFRPKVSLNYYTSRAPYPEADNEYLSDIVTQAIKYHES